MYRSNVPAIKGSISFTSFKVTCAAHAQCILEHNAVIGAEWLACDALPIDPFSSNPGLAKELARVTSGCETRLTQDPELQKQMNDDGYEVSSPAYEVVEYPFCKSKLLASRDSDEDWYEIRFDEKAGVLVIAYDAHEDPTVSFYTLLDMRLFEEAGRYVPDAE